ncbi:hypothetical protein [Chthonobacter albigriseus]|uniref:hypothetical protein n=1 Tax=Chthonobacter albigriseus TaxID=1683161 RepID=UPI0015EE3B03|nr:hypothetical protein [Chthonobacter albigriseus]
MRRLQPINGLTAAPLPGLGKLGDPVPGGAPAVPLLVPPHQSHRPENSLDFSPVADPLQGLARVANNAAAAYRQHKFDQAETARHGQAAVAANAVNHAAGRPTDLTLFTKPSAPTIREALAGAFSRIFGGGR